MRINETGSQSFLRGFGKNPSRSWWVLLLFSLVLQILSIRHVELSGTDSPRVAGIAREMAITSSYLIPRLNGVNFLEYPPLGYWPMAFTLSVSQRPLDFLAFLPIAFLGTGTVLLTFLIGKTLAGERIGLIAGFVLSTMAGFVNLHRHCLVDPALLFFVTLSLYGLAAGSRASKGTFLPFAVYYLAMAGAFLSKGIIGVAIPVTTAAVFLTLRKDLAGARKLLLSPGILLFLLPIFLWAGSVWHLEGFGILEEVIRQSLWRFLSPAADHAKPFYFYVIPAFTQLLPWSLLPLVLIGLRWGRPGSTEPLSQGSLVKFSLVWFLTVFIGLSLASAKRALYLGPLFPPGALLAAFGWDRLREKIPCVKRREAYGLVVLFAVYAGAFLLVILPAERKEGLKSAFETVSRQQTRGPIYLVNASETTRGASFFYLGKRFPVLSQNDVLLGRFQDRPGTTLVIDVLLSKNPFDSTLSLKGYHLLTQQKFKRGQVVCVYSNGP